LPECPPEGNWIELTVTDTGTGMPAEVQRQIFDPFFTTKGLQGTGLGLSVVYGILARQGGRITVASTPGEGTTFTLWFQGAAHHVAPPPMAPLRPGRACRLLLVDDDPAVRTTLAALLRAAGHTVTEADGGKAALALLADQPVDLVLTDLGMPDLTGWEVARLVKAQRAQMPVVLLTGWGEQPDVLAEHPGVVDRVLGKPCRLEELLAVIDALTASPPA
jgi:CheY-like chemotaxis protein